MALQCQETSKWRYRSLAALRASVLKTEKYKATDTFIFKMALLTTSTKWTEKKTKKESSKALAVLENTIKHGADKPYTLP